MKNRISAVVICSLVGLVTTFFTVAEEIPTLPTIPVTAPANTGGNILCYGSSCQGVLRSMQGSPLVLQEVEMPDRDKPINKAAFCRALKSKQPLHCNAASPPLSPGIDSSWKGNGCGTGAKKEWFAALVINKLGTMGNNFSGNLNAPYPGKSFESVCNAHDRCWGMGANKMGCDESFLTGMRGVCATVSASGRGGCNGIASLYHGAVAATTAGNENYEAATSERKCAIWALDMELNSCPK